MKDIMKDMVFSIRRNSPLYHKARKLKQLRDECARLENEIFEMESRPLPQGGTVDKFDIGDGYAECNITKREIVFHSYQ